MSVKNGGNPCDAPCILHEGVEKSVDCLFDKLNKVVDKQFWIMLMLCLNGFLTGMDVAIKLLNVLHPAIGKP